MGRASKINHEFFVKSWMEAFVKKQGIDWVAMQMDISVSSASAKAHYLRARDVQLPPLRRLRQQYDYDKLKQLVDDVLRETGNA